MNFDNTIKCYSIAQLKESIRVLSPVTVPMVIGEAGTGKSSNIEQIGNTLGYDKVVCKRMSGMTDEIFVGIPEKTGNRFEFLKLGFIADIVDSPNEKTLLVLDEINRTPERLRPVLFGLFERLIDDKLYPNLHIVCLVNMGDNYVENWNIAEDSALLSRVTLISYSPSSDDFYDHLEKKQYNKVLQQAVRRINKIIQHETSNELEQTTNFRSWHKFSHILNDAVVATPEEANKKLSFYGRAIFSNGIRVELANAFERMIRMKKELNMKEVITLKKSLNSFEEYLYLTEWCQEDVNKDFVRGSMMNVIEILLNRKELFANFIGTMKTKGLLTKDIVKQLGQKLSIEDKKILMRIL